MARVAMGDVWDDARRFVAREAALLLPLAFATIGLASVIAGLILPMRDADGLLPGPWMLALLPVVLLAMLGNLATSALVLLPRASVGEALREGVKRLPGALLLLSAAVLALVMVLVAALNVAAVAGLPVGLSQLQVASIGKAVAAPATLWLAVRLAVLIPALVAVPATLAVVPVIRRAFALTRGHAGPIAGAVLAFALGYVLIVAALQFGGGALLILAGRAAGAPVLGATVAALLVALVATAMQTMAIVFQAMLYRRLATRDGI